MTAFSPNDTVGLTRHFAEHGWVLLETLGEAAIENLRLWVDEIAGSANGGSDSEILHYREMTDFGPKLCRSENFVPGHAGLRSLLTEGALLEAASLLLGQAAVLYKEKVNYKLAGGAGYAPHQDAPAYPFLKAHVSCMVAIDDSDETNGCLEVVSGMHHDLIPVNEVGCIPHSVVAQLEWTAAPVRAGQTLWFHSLTPHRSGANQSSVDRRALYPTYNALVEGNLRDAYYAEKLRRMSSETVGSNVQVSLIGDFQGRPVT